MGVVRCVCVVCVRLYACCDIVCVVFECCCCVLLCVCVVCCCVLLLWLLNVVEWLKNDLRLSFCIFFPFLSFNFLFCLFLFFQFFLEKKVSSFLFSCISFKYVLLLASVSEFNCFLRSPCSMEMWCRDDIGRDSWDLVGPPARERA